MAVPYPGLDHALIDDGYIAALNGQFLSSGLSVPELERTAWASATTFRSSDKSGGTSGARIWREPQRSWAVNNPAKLAAVLRTLD